MELFVVEGILEGRSLAAAEYDVCRREELRTTEGDTVDADDMMVNFRVNLNAQMDSVRWISES